MKKIKNMKLMLLGLVGLMGTTSAFAAVTKKDDKVSKDGVTYVVKADADVKKDETGRSVNNIVYDLYTITWTATSGTSTFTTKEAYVQGVNASASDAEVATLAIPATVTGDKGTYDVVEIKEGWASAASMKNATALTTTLSVDITNLKTEGVEVEGVYANKTEQVIPAAIFNAFTKLQSLTITDSYAATATAPAKYTKFNGTFAGGAKATLTTVNFASSNISELGEEAFKGCIALTGFDFTKITKIGKSAFEGDYGFTTLTIPATVTSIGVNAFANMWNGGATAEDAKGLKTLTINGAQYQGAPEKWYIPNAFSGNALLESVTIGSTTAKEIEAGAFGKGGVTEGYAPAIKVIDLSGATALETIGEGAFPDGCALTSVKLYGTKLKAIGIDLTKSNRTLATLTLPAGLETLTTKQFKNFIALKELDLSVTKVTSIPEGLLAYTEAPETQELDKDGKPVDGKYIAPVLATVKLNAATEAIARTAFLGQVALTTVENLNQEKLASIGDRAFRGTGLASLDLSSTAIKTIETLTFANMANLATVKLPAVTTIAAKAFANDAKINSINLQDTKITTLNAIFHTGVVGDTDKDEDEEVAIALTSVKLPETLERIEAGALQLTDITEIEIPASVTSIGEYAFQGCIKLEKFTWNDATTRSIANNVFRGDDKLKEVKMVTNDGRSTGIFFTGSKPDGEDKTPDAIFKGNNKSVLKFIVNVEDYNSLVANGWTEANLKYCTLTTEGASEFEFKAAGKYGDYYYATYYNNDQATWFPADKFEVFGAVVEGSNVVMKPFTVEGGYYKVKKADDVCVIRSKEQKAEYELKNADFNDISTAPHDNELKVASKEFTPSRLKYQYKFGVKNGVVAFYRVTSGKIKEGGVYIEASVAAARLNIIFEGEGDATAIQAIATEAENSGAVYNLNGVRVNKAQKGVYIQNGKKFVK